MWVPDEVLLWVPLPDDVLLWLRRYNRYLTMSYFGSGRCDAA